VAPGPARALTGAVRAKPLLRKAFSASTPGPRRPAMAAFFGGALLRTNATICDANATILRRKC